MKFSSKQYALALSEVLKTVSFAETDGVLVNFAKLLKSKKDLKKLRFIKQELRDLEFSEKGIAEAEVFTPFELSEENNVKIKKIISGFLKRNEDLIKIKTVIDEDTIGGFKAKFGDYLINASVQGMLLKLKRNLK